MAVTDQLLLLPEPVVHVQLAVALQRGSVAQPLVDSDPSQAHTTSSCRHSCGDGLQQERSWNYLLSPGMGKSGRGHCEERPLEEHTEEPPAGAGWG